MPQFSILGMQHTKEKAAEAGQKIKLCVFAVKLAGLIHNAKLVKHDMRDMNNNQKKKTTSTPTKDATLWKQSMCRKTVESLCSLHLGAYVMSLSISFPKFLKVAMLVAVWERLLQTISLRLMNLFQGIEIFFHFGLILVLTFKGGIK